MSTPTLAATAATARRLAFITAKRSRILPGPESGSAVARGSGTSWWRSLAAAAEEIQNEGIKEPGPTDHCSKNSPDTVTRAPIPGSDLQNSPKKYPGGRISQKVKCCPLENRIQVSSRNKVINEKIKPSKKRVEKIKKVVSVKKKCLKIFGIIFLTNKCP